MKSKSRKILLGVTASESLKLMNGLPEFLASKGWEVVVVSSWGKQEIPVSINSVKYLDLKMARNPSPLLDLASLIRWMILIFKESPQVVFCGTPKAGMLGIIASWFNATPVRIYHLRGLRLETSTGIARTIYRLVERLVIRLSSVTLCVSPSLRNAVISERLGTANKLKVLGKGSSNGIDIEEFGSIDRWSAEAAKLAADSGVNPLLPVIGFVGRLTSDKGIFDLISAHKELINQNIPNQLLLVGKTDNEQEATKLADLTFESPLIINIGLLNHPQIAYKLMNIFCLPTYREGFPNVVLEAGLSRLPTVTTTATGARDSVISEHTGLLYKPGDVKGLVSALSTLIQNPNLRSMYGKNAFEFVSKEFGRAIVWENIELFLTNTLSFEQKRNL